MPNRVAIVLAFVFVAMLGIGFAPDSALADRSGWIVQFGTAARDTAGGVVVEGKDVYVAGATGGDLGGPNAGGQDIYVRRFNSRGELQWTRQFGTLGDDQATGGLDARRKRVVVGGLVTGALPGQTWFGREDAVLRAYDRDGNVLWTLQFGSSESDRVRSITIAKDGSIFVAGQTTGELTDEPRGGPGDAFVMRLDPDGTVRWLRQFGTSGLDEAIGIAVTRHAVYVTGVTDGAFPGQASAGGSDNFVARFTLDGELEWVTQFGTKAFDATWKIGIVGSTIFVAGNTAGQYPGEISSGGFDALVAALGTDGELKWARQFGTAGNDNVLGLTVDEEGAVVVGRIGGIGGFGSQDPAADGYARKYDADGNVLWMVQFGTATFDNAVDVALKGDDVYVVGQTLGSFPGYTNAGLNDAYVMRFRGLNDDNDDGDGDEDDDD